MMNINKHKHLVSSVVVFFVLYYLILSGNFEGPEIRHEIFWGLIFVPGIFLGFVGSPRDFFGF